MTDSDKQTPRRLGDHIKAFFPEGLATPDLKTHLVFWPLTILGIIADLWTKKAVFDWLADKGSFTVVDGFLYIVTTVNAGAAFGIAQGRRYLLMGVSITALIVILAIFLCSGKEHRVTHIALALFTAGICGNLYDRLFYDGLVRDFIDVIYWKGKHWPAFNIADSMLCIAVGLLLISSFFTGRSGRVHPQQHK